MNNLKNDTELSTESFGLLLKKIESTKVRECRSGISNSRSAKHRDNEDSTCSTIISHEFKRKSKDAPAEMSAKHQVTRFRPVVPVKKHELRDPRFDSLCGTYDEKSFKKAYGFLSEVKKNDLEKLQKELKATDDPKAIKKIKFLIQRLENQLREEARNKQKQELLQVEKKTIIEAKKKGEKPQYRKKSEKKILDLVSQYEELKNSGKLKKHIERIRKKKMSKDRRKFQQFSE